MEMRKECYALGALLYCPALNASLAETVINGKISEKYSLAICLEDTVSDAFVQQAEEQLCHTLNEIFDAHSSIANMPKLFIRVRDPEQLDRVHELVKGYGKILTGYIFPKYTITNAPIYNRKIKAINKNSDKKYYMMPILESEDIIDFGTRASTLLTVKKMIDAVKEYVLNVRVGGNDFCNTFAVRRHYSETIYDILPISNVLSDILTVFSRDYVVSGPVWEFFGSDNNEWKDGLKREVGLDRLNGFVGKTVIHPKQIAVVNDGFKVSNKDFQDAKSILEWNPEQGLQVAKSADGERMNEVKTNGNWAQKILFLAEIYGVN